VTRTAILKIDIRELLAVVVAHDKASVLFFDGPRRREAAGIRTGRRYYYASESDKF